MDTSCLLGIVVGVICAFVGGLLSFSKGHSFGLGFGLGFLLGIIGLIIVVALPKNEKALEERSLAAGTSKKCPYCAEIVKNEAVVCRYCGRELTTASCVPPGLQGITLEENSNPADIKDGGTFS